MVYWTAGLTEHLQRRGAIGIQAPVGIQVNTNLSKAYVFFLTLRLRFPENDRGEREWSRQREKQGQFISMAFSCVEAAVVGHILKSEIHFGNSHI